MIEGVIAAFFSAWLALTVLNYFRLSCLDRLKSFGPFQLVFGRFILFARPAQIEPRFWVRGVRVDGSATEWMQLSRERHSRWWSVVWRPTKRTQRTTLKRLLTVIRTCSRTADRHVIETSFSYLALLNVASSYVRSRNDVGLCYCQMMISQVPVMARDTPELVAVRSRLHRLEL
jgi:hypothetical protein